MDPLLTERPEPAVSCGVMLLGMAPIRSMIRSGPPAPLGAPSHANGSFLLLRSFIQAIAESNQKSVQCP